MIYTEVYTAPEWNERECLRYAGTTPQAVSAEERSLFEACLKEVENKLTYKVCWGRFPVRRLENSLDFGFFKTDSKALMKNLEGCDFEALLIDDGKNRMLLSPVSCTMSW